MCFWLPDGERGEESAWWSPGQVNKMDISATQGGQQTSPCSFCVQRDGLRAMPVWDHLHAGRRSPSLLSLGTFLNCPWPDVLQGPTLMNCRPAQQPLFSRICPRANYFVLAPDYLGTF